jgi:hypothetical protein
MAGSSWLSRIDAVETNPHLSERERGTFGGTVSGSPDSDPRQVSSRSPLPALSGEWIKVRGASDFILTGKWLFSSSVIGMQVAVVATAVLGSAGDSPDPVGDPWSLEILRG